MRAKIIISWLQIICWFLRLLFQTRANLLIENIALRQQLAVLKKDNPRPRLSQFDRFFWVLLHRIWTKWSEPLIIVKPETVVGWHRKGFKLFWTRKSKKKDLGRPRIDKEVRELILRMAFENPGWGAPRIHGELLKLGLDVSERTVSRYMPKRPPSEDQLRKWKVFLKLHAQGIAAMDFFTVPTVTFKMLYVWFVVHHASRKILHFNISYHPHSAWVIQNLKEAFPWNESPEYLIFDRDSKFSRAVVQTIKSFDIKPVRTAYRRPWQNP